MSGKSSDLALLTVCKVRKQFPSPSSFLVPTAEFGGPQTTLSFSNSLEGLTELTKAVKLTVTDYYSKRIEIKISQGKRHMGRDQEGFRY